MDLEELSVERLCGTRVKCVAGDYFTPQGLLRIHVGNSVQKLYNEFQRFHGVSIPHSIEMAGLAGEILTISVTSVEPLTPSESQLLEGTAASPDLPCSICFPSILLPSVENQEELMSDKVTRSRITDQIAPVYPRAALQKQF